MRHTAEALNALMQKKKSTVSGVAFLTTGKRELLAKEQKIKFLAHRGYSKKYPQNTILSFQKAYGAGFSSFECDVRFTKDSIPFISHKLFLSFPLVLEFISSKLAERIIIENQIQMPKAEEVLKFVKEKRFPVIFHLKIGSLKNYKSLFNLIEKTETGKLAQIMISGRRAQKLGLKNQSLVIFFRFPYLHLQKICEECEPEKIIIFVPRRLGGTFLSKIIGLDKTINRITKIKTNNYSIGIFNDKKSLEWARKLGFNEIWTNDIHLLEHLS